MSKVYLVINDKNILMKPIEIYNVTRTNYKIDFMCGNCKTSIDISKSDSFVRVVNMVFPNETNYSLKEFRIFARWFNLEEIYIEAKDKYLFIATLSGEQTIPFLKDISCPYCRKNNFVCLAQTGDNSHAPGQFLHLIGIKTVE
jgi:hypothetical protein